MLTFDWSSLILFSSVINTFIIFIILFVNRMKYELKSFVAIILILISIQCIILERIIRFSGLEENFPEFLFTTSPLFFIILPLIYCFQRLMTQLPKYWYLHFILPLLLLIILIPTFTMDPMKKLEMYNTKGINDPLWITLFYAYYAAFYIAKIFSVNKLHSNYLLNEYANNNVEVQVFANRLIFYSSLLMFCIPLSFLIQYTSLDSNISEKVLFVIFSASTHLILFSLITKNRWATVSAKETSKEDTNQLTDIDLSKEVSELGDYVIKNKSFTNRDLTLQILADEIGWSRSKLSIVINKGFHKNFYDFINHLRVELVIDRLKHKEYENYSLDYIVSESGFKNYVSFYRVFKRIKKQSPKEYIKKLKDL